MITTLENKYKVKKIQYLASAFTKCPIGKNWSRMHLEVNMEVGDIIPNYDVIDEYIQNEIDNHEFIIEEVGYRVYEFFKKLCQPKHLQVIIHDENNSFNTTYITIEE